MLQAKWLHYIRLLNFIFYSFLCYLFILCIFYCVFLYIQSFKYSHCLHTAKINNIRHRHRKDFNATSSGITYRHTKDFNATASCYKRHISLIEQTHQLAQETKQKETPSEMPKPNRRKMQSRARKVPVKRFIIHTTLK